MIQCAVRKKVQVHVCLCHGQRKGLRTHPMFKKDREEEALHLALFELVVVSGY